MPGAPPAQGYRQFEGFQVVRRGYDQRQVDSHLDRLDAEVRILVADRNAAVEQAMQHAQELDEARARTERLRAQVRGLMSTPASVPGMSDRMRSMLRLAEDEVDEMLTRAETEAARCRHEAEQQAAEIRSTALADAERAAAEDAKRRAECEAEIAAATAAMVERRRVFTAELDAERAASAARIAHAEQDARQQRAEEQAAWESRKALVEEDFARAMDQRRAEALAELERGRTETYRFNADMIATAQEQSRRAVTVAEEYARHIVTDAQRRVAELTTARERVAGQLAQARRTLAGALGVLSATPERDGLDRAAPVLAYSPTAAIAAPAAGPAPAAIAGGASLDGASLDGASLDGADGRTQEAARTPNAAVAESAPSEPAGGTPGPVGSDHAPDGAGPHDLAAARRGTQAPTVAFAGASPDDAAVPLRWAAISTAPDWDSPAPHDLLPPRPGPARGITEVAATERATAQEPAANGAAGSDPTGTPHPRPRSRRRTARRS